MASYVRFHTIKSEALPFCLVAFSIEKPVSTFSENALSCTDVVPVAIGPTVN
jgi:hypothetical protein